MTISSEEAREIIARILRGDPIHQKDVDAYEDYSRQLPLFDPHTPIEVDDVPGHFISWPPPIVED